jgi:hypothetical protein
MGARNLFPRKPLHPAVEHVPRHGVASREELTDENFEFNVVAQVNGIAMNSGVQGAIICQEQIPSASLVYTSHESAEDVSGQVPYTSSAGMPPELDGTGYGSGCFFEKGGR